MGGCPCPWKAAAQRQLKVICVFNSRSIYSRREENQQSDSQAESCFTRPKTSRVTLASSQLWDIQLIGKTAYLMAVWPFIGGVLGSHILCSPFWVSVNDLWTRWEGRNINHGSVLKDWSNEWSARLQTKRDGPNTYRLWYLRRECYMKLQVDACTRENGSKLLEAVKFTCLGACTFQTSSVYLWEIAHKGWDSLQTQAWSYSLPVVVLSDQYGMVNQDKVHP